MPDSTHNISTTSLAVFYGNSYVFIVIPCVLQHFIATGVPSFIPDDTIIATVAHCYMPEITHNATVALCFLPDYDSSRCAVLGEVFTIQGVRSCFHKHCTPPERPFCQHTALLSLAIRQDCCGKSPCLPAKILVIRRALLYENNF